MFSNNLTQTNTYYHCEICNELNRYETKDKDFKKQLS